MRLPPMQAWANPFGEWIDSARANGAARAPKPKHGKRRGAKRKDRG